MDIPKIPVTDADREKSYFKYYDRMPASIPEYKKANVFGPAISSKDAIAFEYRNKILDLESYTIGQCVMPDGTGYICDETFIKDASADMLDWYFAWRGLDALRFIIVDPVKNRSALTMQSGYALDEDRNLKEKYWDTTQVVISGMGFAPKKEYLNFKCPSDVGFDMEKIGEDKLTKSLICARNYADGQPPNASPDYFICHQVLSVEGGIKVVTRIWYGHTVRYGLNYKSLPDGFIMPTHMPKDLLIENANFFANLSEILPSLYSEEKDNF